MQQTMSSYPTTASSSAAQQSVGTCSSVRIAPTIRLRCVTSLCSRLAPPLNQQEEVYLRSLSDVAGSVLGFDVQHAGTQGVQQLLSLAKLALNPTAQVSFPSDVIGTACSASACYGLELLVLCVRVCCSTSACLADQGFAARVHWRHQRP